MFVLYRSSLQKKEREEQTRLEPNVSSTDALEEYTFMLSKPQENCHSESFRLPTRYDVATCINRFWMCFWIRLYKIQFFFYM